MTAPKPTWRVPPERRARELVDEATPEFTKIEPVEVVAPSSLMEPVLVEMLPALP